MRLSERLPFQEGRRSLVPLLLCRVACSHLQAVWKANGLPEDLFYPEHEVRCVPVPEMRLGARCLQKLGVRKRYTPKRWEIARGMKDVR